MIGKERFELLLRQMEGETVDFKRDSYDLQNEDSKYSMVKDIICMSNTPRESTAYIITGVAKHKDGNFDLIGVDQHPDDADLQSQLSNRVYPVPSFSYEVEVYEGKKFGVFVFPLTRVGPCVPLKDLGGALRRWQIYFRRGSKNDMAAPSDAARIMAWFGKEIVSREAYEASNPSWESFLQAVGSFEQDRNYVLIASPMRDDVAVLSPLGRVPWAAVFDFDPKSDVSGLLSACKETIENHRSLHLLTLQDHTNFNLKSGTYWIFARGLEGRHGTVELGEWRKWRASCGAALSERLRQLAAASAPAPITFVVAWLDPSLIRQLDSVLGDALGSFSDLATFLVVTGNASDLQAVADTVGAQIFEMPIHHLTSGVQSLYPANLAITEDESPFLPVSSGAPVRLSSKDRAWIEEEIELTHLGTGQTASGTRNIGRDFLRGSEVSWYELGLHYDIDRDQTDKIRGQLEKDLRTERTARINLYHDPGAGATTVARRLLWDLHRTYPCAILRKTKPSETADRLSRIASITGRPIVLLVDGAQVTERSIGELYEYLTARRTPVVLLQVLRRFTTHTPGPRSFHLPVTLSDTEAERFAHVFSREVPLKRRQIETVLTSANKRLRSAFYFGLVAFQKDFLGLGSFVGKRIASLSQAQKKILGFLAIAHHYGQQSLPSQAFSDTLALPRGRKVDLTTALPQIVLDLLVAIDTEGSKWRTMHDLVAIEILQQLLTPDRGDSRLWPQQLSEWAVEFAHFCCGWSPVPSDEMLEVARRTFVYRDNTELLGTERAGTKQFAQLIQEIPSDEGKLVVLRTLTDLYPNEAHFWAHLGRFYSIERRDHENALIVIDRAIASEPTDSVLHHMRGMALRQQVYERVQQKQPLEEVLKLAIDASAAFERARELNPDDDHGYISEVQMILKLIDYAGSKHPLGVHGYIGSPEAVPYLRDCFERAEDLLERVRGNREGEGLSHYEQSCRGEIDALYGQYEQALQVFDSLLARSDVFCPPVRRQIVWTYLARRGRRWDHLTSREVDRAVSLLEDNLREEPHSGTNLRLWVQAVRRSSHPPSLETVIEKVSYWRANADSLEAAYYLYVLYCVQAMEGSTVARDFALRFRDDCRARARLRRNRTKSFEWLGSGTGIPRLVHHSQLGEWKPDIDFWENTQPLARAHGRISRFDGPQAGEVEVAGGLPAFFVPA